MIIKEMFKENHIKKIAEIKMQQEAGRYVGEILIKLKKKKIENRQDSQGLNVGDTLFK